MGQGSKFRRCQILPTEKPVVASKYLPFCSAGPQIPSVFKGKPWHLEDWADSEYYYKMTCLMSSVIEPRRECWGVFLKGLCLLFAFCYVLCFHCPLFWQAIEKFGMSMSNFFFNLVAGKEPEPLLTCLSGHTGCATSVGALGINTHRRFSRSVHTAEQKPWEIHLFLSSTGPPSPK